MQKIKTNIKPKSPGVLFVIMDNGKKTVFNYTGSVVSFMSLRDQYEYYIDESEVEEAAGNERTAEAVEFFTMQQFPTQEPGETFSKTVLIFDKEDHSFCDLGYYDFKTSEWAILGDMSMKLICWCYIPDASTFINGKELREELHRGYC